MATSRVFVSGLPPSLTEADLRKHFSAKNREVTDVKIIPQRRIGYVGFKTADDASKAIKYFNKSFIRMSKISVEAARPISDSVPAKTREGKAQLFATTKKQDDTPSISEKEASPKKRKRDVPDESDPKLREYLQVMKSGRDGVAAGEMDLEANQNSQDATKGAEGESDEEYEDIPTQQKKQKRTDPSAAAAFKEPTAVSKQITKVAKQPDVSAEEGSADHTDQEEQVVGHEATKTTDDDWLRSRTNRLLDLVDPDELPSVDKEPKILAPGNGSAGTAVIKDKEPLTPADQTQDTTQDEAEEEHEGVDSESTEESIRRTSRLFIRNLPYTANEDDLRDSLAKYGEVEEVHVPVSAGGASKGFALIQFVDASSAVEAFQSLDGTTFQGRIIHIIPAKAKRDQGLDEFEISKLPLKKQNILRKKAGAAASTFNWNSLYMSQDAVNSSVATRMGVSKSELLDPTSADAAVKQAIAETTVIQETKAYFAANGVDLNAFKSQKRRGDTTILVKNFPYGTTMEEIRKLFEESGSVLRVLMPPSGTIAIVQFSQANQAKAAFGKLAYRRIKDSVLFLEKAPKDLFVTEPSNSVTQPEDRSAAGVSKLSVNDLLSRGDKADEEVETTSLFVRNLNFATTTNRLAEAFESLDGFVAATVKTKMDPKKPGQTLSMGFGFVDFRSKAQAQAALKIMDGYVLDDHTLAVKASHRGHDAAEERRREDKAKKASGQRTKIIVKNLPFQTTKKDVRALFGTYGQLRSVRVPKKADYTARGFAFADFITPREAENALNALRDTHLLGRRLVLDFAEAEAVNAEEEIEKMQRKVGGQVNKVALQQLTGGGRKKVNIGNEEDDVEG